MKDQQELVSIGQKQSPLPRGLIFVIKSYSINMSVVQWGCITYQTVIYVRAQQPLTFEVSFSLPFSPQQENTAGLVTKIVIQ